MEWYASSFCVCIFVVVVTAFSCICSATYDRMPRTSLQNRLCTLGWKVSQLRTLAIVWPSIDTIHMSTPEQTTCFTHHNITLSHPFFPFFLYEHAALYGITLIFVIISTADSSARNVLDADEVSTLTIGWDAREAACTISRVSRATRANDNFPPARSSRSRKDTFSVNYTTWRVWRFSHPTTLRKRVSLFCALYTICVNCNRLLFEEKRL